MESTIKQCHDGNVYFDRTDRQYKQECKQCGRIHKVDIVNIGYSKSELTDLRKKLSKAVCNPRYRKLIFANLREQLEFGKENLQQARTFYPTILDASRQSVNSQDDEKYGKCNYVNGVCINCGQKQLNEVTEQEAWIHTLKR